MLQKRAGLIGVLLVIGGGVSYPLLLDHAWIRSTAIPNLIMTVFGLSLCAWAVIRRRSKATVTCAVVGGLVGFGLLFGLFVMLRLPAATGAPAVGAVAADFTLPNQDGELVRLASYRSTGPVLLVFYRGHW